MNDNISVTIEDALLDAQKATLAVVMEGVASYLKKKDANSTVTAQELCENVLGMASATTVSMAFHSSSSGKKKSERDEENGCQRIMGERSGSRAGHPCGNKVYVETATGREAIFCSKCMNGLKGFRAAAAPIIQKFGLSWDEATAGKYQDVTAPTTGPTVVGPNAQYYPPQQVVYPPQYQGSPPPVQAPAPVQVPGAPGRVAPPPTRRDRKVIPMPPLEV